MVFDSLNRSSVRNREVKYLSISLFPICKDGLLFIELEKNFGRISLRKFWSQRGEFWTC